MKDDRRVSPAEAEECWRLQEDPPAGVSGAPSENNIMVWNAVIFGPEGTPFEDGTFKLTIEFTEEYPNKPPTVRFVSKMFHPNVYADGSICLDILQNRWSPTYDVSSILTSIQSLLDEPNPNSPANSQAAQLYQENKREYEKRVSAIVEQSWQLFLYFDWFCDALPVSTQPTSFPAHLAEQLVSYVVFLNLLPRGLLSRASQDLGSGYGVVLHTVPPGKLHTSSDDQAELLKWTHVLHTPTRSCYLKKSLCLYLFGNPKSQNCAVALGQKQASGRMSPELCRCMMSVQSPTIWNRVTHSSCDPYRSPSHQRHCLRCFHH
ncbi:hypothetical protein F7725_010415 [Dissostichus mawsoni]|uniref:E2 ubiquitin-conjugating enzyme n=1 Tax=Dissostichus mawsoni TaxID=36200 RepID=A0A7J5XPX7_DISMA|nr:hypothetical protein F7725_010415 [Dissostichus mawsoni]